MPLVTMRQPLDEAAAGVRKVNIDTDGRLAITAGVREDLKNDPGNWDPRGVGRVARRAMKELVAQRMQELGMAGHAGDYAPMSLEEMAKRHAAGVRFAA